MSSSSPPPSTDGLTSALPEEIIIYLTRFLGSRDVLNLSFTCSRLLRSYANDHLWLQFFQRERLKRENSITKVARIELAKGMRNNQIYFTSVTAMSKISSGCKFIDFSVGMQ